MLRERGKCARRVRRACHTRTEFSRPDAAGPSAEPNPIQHGERHGFWKQFWTDYGLIYFWIPTRPKSPAEGSARVREPLVTPRGASVDKTNYACAPPVFFYALQICSNLNQCFCDNRWTGVDCSIQLETSPTSPSSAEATLSPEDAKKAKNDLESKMIMKETPYGKTVACAVIT